VKARGLFTRTALVLGLAFLYLPILSMMVYSFNNSRLVTVWDAAHSPTLKWYVALLSNEQILRAAWLSIRIAVISASAAVVLGTLAGMALARLGAFRGRMLLAGMTAAPIVMPEVITGLSLLLLFVALGQLIGWPKGVGAVTITLAHITFCMAYVTVVVQSRLAGFDEALEEAAMDLGARPAGVFSASRCRSSCRQLPPGGCWPLHCPGTIWSSRSSSRDRVPAHCRWSFFPRCASA